MSNVSSNSASTRAVHQRWPGIPEPLLDAMLRGGYSDAEIAQTEIVGFDRPSDPARIEGHSNWIAYLPGCSRALHMNSCGEVGWFDAGSVDSAAISGTRRICR
jgi:hypothetical protein